MVHNPPSSTVATGFQRSSDIYSLKKPFFCTLLPCTIDALIMYKAVPPCTYRWPWCTQICTGQLPEIGVPTCSVPTMCHTSLPTAL